MAIKLEHVMLLTARLQQELETLRAQSPSKLTDVARWALFVTEKELNELMDEVMVSEEFKASMTKKEMQDIRDQRAMWHMNGIFVLPELQDEVEKLNG